MFAAYREAGIDPELMSLRQDVALIDARIIDVLKRVDTGEAGVIWQAAQAAMGRFGRARANKDVDGMTDALADVQRLVTQGAADYAAWREVGQLIEKRRHLVVAEQRRLTLASEMLGREQVLALMGQVVDIIRRRVPDREVLHLIARDMQAMGHRGNGHSAAVD
jgi:hypothetical protein